jgi:hypothetical protein
MKKKLIIWIIGWTILYVVFFLLLPYLNDRYHGCYLHNDVYVQSINGSVLQKFVDPKNHNDQVIIYSAVNKGQEMMVFTPEFYDMFDLINVGDSIIKEKNSIDYKVIFKSTGKDTIFEFHTTCKDSLKRPR